MKEYVESGKLRYAIIDLALSSHKFAFKAAEAGLCAKEQGKFWEMHHCLMTEQKALDDLTSHAESIHLDIDKFEACLNTSKYADEVRADIALARKLQISGTPSFVIARTNPEDSSRVKGIGFIRGAMPFESFKQAIDKALADVNK